MPFPLRGRNCFVEDVTLEYGSQQADPEADAGALGESLSVKPPAELGSYSREELLDSFKTRLSKNLMEFGINLVDQAAAAPIKVTVRIVVDDGLDVSAKGTIVADGTEFVVGSKAESYDKLPNLDDGSSGLNVAINLAANILNPSPAYNLGLHGAINLAAEKLSYRIHETLIDFYQDKPELPDFEDQSGANLVDGGPARKFDRSKVLQVLLLAALIGFVVYRYVAPDFLQALRQYAGQGAAPAPVGEKSAESYWQRGYDHYKSGHYGPAISEYTKALEIDPRSVKVYYSRGLTYAQQGNYGQAIADINQALDIDPKSKHAYSYRAYVHFRQCRYDQAIADLNQALEIDPKFGLAYNARARVHFGNKAYDKAWEDVRQAQNLGEKINPKFLQDLRQASGRQN